MQAYHQLSYHTHYWLLHSIDGLETRFENARISFDGGLFIVLTLTNEMLSKNLIIFVDQLSLAQYRILNVIGKISFSKQAPSNVNVNW